MPRVIRLSRSGAVALIALCGLAGHPASAAAVDIPLRNWTAPKSWTPPAGSGRRRLMTDVGNPVPLIPITPCRIADTRGLGFSGQAGPPALAANTARNFQVTGVVATIPTQCGIPASAHAASFNFTVVNMTSNGNLTAWPAGSAQPNTSVLNWSAGSGVVGNSGIVAISSGGALRVFANTPAGASVDLIIDVNGYYTDTLNDNEGFGVAGNTANNAVIYGHNSGAFGMGVWGDSSTGYGVYGTSGGTGYGSIGVWGTSVNGLGIFGSSSTLNGVYASSNTSDALVTNGGRDGALIMGNRNGLSATDGSGFPQGTYGINNAGVIGGTVSGAGILGVAQLNAGGVAGSFHRLNDASPFGDTTRAVLCPSGATAGNFFGNVNINAAIAPGTGNGNLSVNGTLSKGGGSFKIDHPLDPENKYLYHSFVESPDMMNVYNGNVTLDARGEADVALPAYFEALNSDFRYQLTSIGRFSPVYVAEEIANNHFRIAGGRPGGKVSWQVTGIRRDAFANAHRVQVEVEKETELKGTYLHPAELGKSLDLAAAAVMEKAERKRESAERNPRE